jgi:phosphoglucomutase
VREKDCGLDFQIQYPNGWLVAQLSGCFERTMKIVPQPFEGSRGRSKDFKKGKS